MNNFNKKLIFKGQPNGCPLLFKAIFIIGLTCLLSACSKKQTDGQLVHPQIQCQEKSCPQALINEHLEDFKKVVVDIKKPHYKTFVNQARNIDVSTPVGFKLVKSDSKEATTFFVYHGNQNIEKIMLFYNHELEISGWDFKDLSTKQEGLFVCNKSTKTCVVSIRPKETSGSIICITVTRTLGQN